MTTNNAACIYRILGLFWPTEVSLHHEDLVSVISKDQLSLLEFLEASKCLGEIEGIIEAYANKVQEILQKEGK